MFLWSENFSNKIRAYNSMEIKKVTELSYFPGCSLKSTAQENNISLVHLMRHLGFKLVELDDWNCCGSSSAHSVNAKLAQDLATRNLSLVPPGRPLLVACPSCLLRLRTAHLHLKNDKIARASYEKLWKKPFDPDLKIIHFFEFLDGKAPPSFPAEKSQNLKGLKFAPYYGCMLSNPPDMNNEKKHHGLMENILTSHGAIPLNWSHTYRCCGTYLSVVRPDVTEPIVNEILRDAVEIGADCIVTACAMCQMNLDMRSTSKHKIPILHLSEVLALGLGLKKNEYLRWFSRHLVNPKQVFKSIGFFK